MPARKKAAKKAMTKVAKKATKKVAEKAPKRSAARKATAKKAAAKPVIKKKVIKKPASAKAAGAKPVIKRPAVKTPAATKPGAIPAAGKLTAGAAAPAFALKDQGGKTVTLKSFAGRKLLVYFYPKADTPGCTVQSCSVRDHRQGLKGLGIDVVGISPDTPKEQAKFDRKFSLGFPLLADESHAVAEGFGVWGEKSMYGRTYMGIVRSSFLIDETGRIIASWYGVKPEDTVPNAQAALSR